MGQEHGANISFHFIDRKRKQHTSTSTNYTPTFGFLPSVGKLFFKAIQTIYPTGINGTAHRQLEQPRTPPLASYALTPTCPPLPTDRSTHQLQVTVALEASTTSGSAVKISTVILLRFFLTESSASHGRGPTCYARRVMTNVLCSVVYYLT